MNTLHIDNTVRDFDSWKEAFDKYDSLRKDGGVRSYRITRDSGDPQRVHVDLAFDDDAAATAFRGALAKVWQTPQAQQLLLAPSTATLLTVVEDRTL